MPARDQPLRFSGVVLAGGRSSRMGTEKALLNSDGQPLWRRQYELLAAAGAGERLISVRADQTWPPLDVLRVNDEPPDCGPLAGLAAALAAGCSGTHVILLAVDLPRLPLAWLERLRRLCRPGLGGIGVQAEGAFEPLAAIYPVEIGLLVTGALGRGEFSLQNLVRRGVDAGWMKVEPIAAGERCWFENWNTPGDVAPPTSKP